MKPTKLAECHHGLATVLLGDELILCAASGIGRPAWCEKMSDTYACDSGQLSATAQ